MQPPKTGLPKENVARARGREGVGGVHREEEEKVLHASEKLEQNLLASKHKMEL